MARLRPCGSCARHVRFEETACPFCGGALASVVARDAGDAGAARAVADLGRPLSRSAVVFFGATTLAACVGGPGDLPTGSSGTTTSSGASGSSGRSSSSSGGSSSSSGSSTSSASGGSSTSSSASSSGGSSGTSGTSGISSGAVPLYGPAIVDSGK